MLEMDQSWFRMQSTVATAQHLGSTAIDVPSHAAHCLSWHLNMQGVECIQACEMVKWPV